MQTKTTRRQFLKKATLTAGILAFPDIVPATVLGRGKNIPPSDRIVMGCIGLGGQGTFNMLAFASQPDVQIVALCDVDEGVGYYDNLYQSPGSQAAGLAPARERLFKHYADKNEPISFASIESYKDFRELLAYTDIDAVTVCTPDHWHGLISIAALRSGKDVYCEKPLVNSIDEGRAVCDAVREYGRILQTGSHERSNDSVRYAYELVRNGRIGKLHTIYINMPNNDPHHIRLRKNTGPKPVMPIPEGFDYNMWLGPAPWADYTRERTHFWWRFILEYGGGEMTDRGAHIIDLAQFINDTDDSGPVEIFGRGRPIGNGLYDCFIEYDFECLYQNGVRLIGGSEGDRGLKLVGSDGWISIHIHGGRLDADPKSILKESIAPDEIHTERSPGHHRNFLDSVKSRKKPVAHEEIGHRTATICHLVNIAMLTERRLKWDPEREQITNDDKVNKMVSKPKRSPWRI